MTQAERIQGIIFDLDGTLYEHRWLKLGLTLRNIKSLQHLFRLEKGRNAVRHTSFPDDRSLIAATSRIACPSNPQAFQLWYESQFYSSFISLLKPHMLRSGTEALLRKLSERKIKLAVCSDYAFVAERLEALGLSLDHFDEIISAEECGHLKPQPQSYRKILSNFSIAASQVLIVGDRPETDGVAAKDLGCRFYEVRSGDNWSALIELLESAP